MKMNTAAAISFFRLYTRECFYLQIPITNPDERKDVSLDRYTRRMEQAMGFLSRKAKETVGKGRGKDSRNLPRGHSYVDQGNYRVF